MEKHTAKKNKQTRQDRRQRIRQERKKDRRFLRMTVPLLTLLAALLLGGLFYWETHKAALYARWAYAAMEREDMEAAERLARTGEDAGETGLQQRIEYAYAGKKLEAAAYEEAESLFLELGAYEDAPQKALQCRYELAMAAMAAGDYVRAEEDLRKAAGYGDALQQLDACRYAMAEQAETGGELDKAFSLFWELGDYRDARDRAAAAAIKKDRGNGSGKSNSSLPGVYPGTMGGCTAAADPAGGACFRHGGGGLGACFGTDGGRKSPFRRG